MIDTGVPAWIWVTIGQWVFDLLISGWALISRKQAVTNKRVEEINESLTARIDQTEKELIRVCSDLEHLPHQMQFTKLGEQITDLTSELGEVKGRLGGINRAVDLINEFLINQGANK
jgi:hypothetical protein